MNAKNKSFSSLLYVSDSPHCYHYGFCYVVSFEAKWPHYRSYSIKEKREFVQAINTLVSTGASHCDKCYLVGLPHMYYACFKKAVEKVDGLEKSAAYIQYKTKGSACKIHPDPKSLLTAIQKDLARFVKHVRHSRIQVITHVIHQETSCLLLTFRDNSLMVQNMAASLFIWVCLIVWLITLHRNTTRKCKKSQLISSNLRG
jgi:hypothetical protein